jgi:hypothetical protein
MTKYIKDKNTGEIFGVSEEVAEILSVPTDIIAEEITKEIDREILEDLKKTLLKDNK